MRDVTIQVDRSRGKLRFRLKAMDGPVQVMTIAIIKKGVESPLWWLVPESFVQELPFTIATPPSPEPVKERPDLGLAEADWTEEALLKKLGLDSSNREIQDLSYGEIPPGFRQAFPRQGEAPQLEPGEAYMIMVVGACCGKAAFEG